MKRMAEFPLQGGGSILVELDEAQQDEMVPAARPGEVAAKAKQTFEQIKPAAPERL